MRGSAIFFYGESYDKLPSLSSPKRSIEYVRRTIEKDITSTYYSPEWVHLELPKPIGTSEIIKTNLSNFSAEVTLNGSDIILIYISGHGYAIAQGEIYVYSSDSNPKTPKTGISLTDIVEILLQRIRRNVVLVLEICRTHNHNFKKFETFYKNSIKKYKESFSSFLLLLSTEDGEIAYGGIPHGISPFAYSISQILCSDYIGYPVSMLKSGIEEILKLYYEQNHTNYSFPEVLPLPDNQNTIFGFIPQPIAGPDVKSSLNSDIERLLKSVVDTYKASLDMDPYLDDKKVIWPVKILVAEKEIDIEKVIEDNNNPLLIVGQSGSGKTLQAKRISYLMALEFTENKRIALFFNAGFLNRTNNDDFLSILKDYFVNGRYQVAIQEVEELYKYNHVTFLIDGVEDLRNKDRLNYFIKSCKQAKINYILFCQPYDEEWLKMMLEESFLQCVRLLPVPITFLDMNDDNKKKAEELFGKSLIPMKLQILKEFYMKKNDVPHNSKELSYFEINNVKNLLLKQLEKEKFFEIKNNLHRTEDGKEFILMLYEEFSKQLREYGFFQFFPVSTAQVVLQNILVDKSVGISFDDFVDLGRRAKLFDIRMEGKTLKYTHRKIQELLIAHYWVLNEIKKSELINYSGNIIWHTVIGEYSVIAEKDNFPFKEITQKNPFCSITCIEIGYVVDDSSFQVLLDEILNYSSHWARNQVSNSLLAIPEKYHCILRKLFLKEKEFDKKTSLAITIGLSKGSDNINFLFDQYKNLLHVDDNNTNYLRRRILDALKDKISLDRINEWLDLKANIIPHEWARILRSYSPESQDDINRLKLISQTKYSADEVKVFDIVFLYKEIDFRKKRDLPYNELLSQLETKIISSLETNRDDRFYKCIPTLIIGDANLERLADMLTVKLLKEKDLYAKGDMVYVLGKIGNERHIQELLLKLPELIENDEFKNATALNKEGFINDIKMGLRRAIIKGTIKEDIFNLTLPPEFKNFVLTLLYNKDNSSQF